MRRFIPILIPVLMLGCDGSFRPKKPGNLIPESKMADVLYDVFMLNAAKGVNKKVLENNGVMPQKYLLDKYGIDSTQFAKSNEYYAYDTKTYSSIISKVKAKIEAEKKVVDSIIELEEKKQDSIKKSKIKKTEIDTAKSIFIDSKILDK